MYLFVFVNSFLLIVWFCKSYVNLLVVVIRGNVKFFVMFFVLDGEFLGIKC